MRFLVTTLPGSVIAVDMTNAGPVATAAPSHQFNSVQDWKEYFFKLGAPVETLDAVATNLKEKGHEVLEF